MKDIEGAVSIYQLGARPFPPLRTISNTNLPRPASSFVGREREREEVVREIREGARLLTLTGPGGSGKTRLALEAAAELVFSYKAGVFWVGLASLREASLVTDTIAQTLGARDSLAEHISEREMLILLDNLEQVIEAAPELSALLQMCPNLALLCTSRELLRVQGEVEYLVPPLASSEAVSLFCERSRLEATAEITELCRRLDEMPLAVELAAARARVLTPAQIVDRLAQRLDLLKGGRDADPRQQTLRATIEWSHDLLGAVEKQLLARLAVFVGGCTLDAAEDVCDADVDVLQSLVDKSLLRHTGDRFWMLETIHEYAHERLVASGEADLIRQRHANWYASLAAPPDGIYWFTSPPRVEALERELDNFRSVLELAILQVDANRALAVALGLFPVWEMRDRLTEGDLWLGRALALEDGSGILRGQALGARTALSYHLGRADIARDFASEGAKLLREHGSDAELAMALIAVTWGLRDESLPEALLAGEEALQLARRSGSGVAVALHSLGGLELQQGAYDAALPLLEEALELSREIGSFGFVVAISHSLGDLELRRGNDAAAWDRYLEAGRLGVAEGVPEQVGLCVGGLAAVAARQGRAKVAGRLWSSVKQWEAQRGSPLLAVERELYETIVAAAAADDGQPPLSLEAALRLAHASR